MASLVNTHWRHRKRGSVYRVLMDWTFEFDGLHDGLDGYAVLHGGGGSILATLEGVDLSDAAMVLPVSIQISRPVPAEPSYANWIIYRRVDPHDVSSVVYARPAGEFVDGRFVMLSQQEVRHA
jgi:hypothetical protein